MHHKIIGTNNPVLEVTLELGETILAEAWRVSWMSSNIGLVARGAPGLFESIGRALSGAPPVMTELTALNAQGFVGFAAKLPGQIAPLTIGPGQNYVVHGQGLLCSTPGVALSGSIPMTGTSIGFDPRRLTGTGVAFVELSGELVIHDLPAGQSMRVHPMHVALLQETVHLELAAVPGAQNVLFGGSSPSLATLTGPGRVWLQSLSLSHVANGVAPYLSHGR
jgi:uncharacterized protein (AIM24 family)